MTNDDDALSRMRLHQECWDLLPWVVNGRLPSADAARVAEHLRECTRCSEELQAQQQLCEALRRDDPVLLAPQASLQKLWQRFDAAAAPPTASFEGHARAETGSRPLQECIPAAAAAPKAHPAKSAGASPRVRLALAAQALLIVGLLGVVGWQTFERWQAPRFVTLTTPATPSERAAAVRVVFVANAAMRDVNALLHSFRAEILAGPNSAGVFTLGLPTGVNADSAAVELRNHPHVQFAESILTASVQP